MAKKGTIAITNEPTRSAYKVGIQSAVLDAAADETNEFNSNGFKEHSVCVTPTDSTDVNTILAKLWVSQDEGASYFVVDSDTYVAADDGIPQTLTFSGYAYDMKLELDAVGGGTPSLANISFVSHTRFTSLT